MKMTAWKRFLYFILPLKFRRRLLTRANNPTVKFLFRFKARSVLTCKVQC